MPVAMAAAKEAKLTTYFPLLFWLFLPLLQLSLLRSVRRPQGNKKGAAAAATAESRFVTRRRFFVSPSIFAFSPPAGQGEFFLFLRHLP